MKYAYNTIAGTLAVDLHENFARMSNLDKPKLFTGSNPNAIHEKIMAWIDKEMGGLNYRSLSNGTIHKLDQATIEKNLNRFNQFKSIQNALAQRLAGSYDVLQKTVVDPYTETHLYILKDDVTYTTQGSSFDQVLKEIASHFIQEGYFKMWYPRPGEKSIREGLASVPVTDYRLVSSDGNLE